MFDPQRKRSLAFRIFSRFHLMVIVISFALPANMAHAQNFNVLSLPKPGSMVTTSEKFVPVILKGITLDPQNPLIFNFIVDPGNTNFGPEEVREDGERLIKYFLAALTIPEKDLWVNLSPYEKDRIVPEAFGQTDMGRDLLAQDYILKQLSASLIYPEKDLGKEFWSRVYAKAKAQYGTTEIPMNTFNKVWIVPGKSVVIENKNTAFVVRSHLKVMLEEDYVALDENRASEVLGTSYLKDKDVNQVSSVASDIVKEIILPEIEREVNEGKNFANLRQIYSALVLAAWFKYNLKENILNQVYTGQNKILGVDIADKDSKEKIYQRYLDAYRQGAFNYIKEDKDASGEVIPRKYFSGGAVAPLIDVEREIEHIDASNPGALAREIQKGTLNQNDLAGEEKKGLVKIGIALSPDVPGVHKAEEEANQKSKAEGGDNSMLSAPVIEQINQSRDRTARMAQALQEKRIDDLNTIFEEARVNLPGGKESRPLLFTIASSQTPQEINLSWSTSKIIQKVREVANFELTEQEASKFKAGETFDFDNLEQSQRNGDLYLAALKSGLLGTRYVVTNIKRFSPDSHLMYMNNMQSLVDQFNGNVVVLLSVEESDKVLKGDGAGMGTAVDAIATVLGEDFMRKNSMDIITDGGLKTRGGNITGKYGYNGVMPTADGTDYYFRSIKTLGQVRLQHKGYGANRDFWTASDGDYNVGNITFGSRRVSDLDNDGTWKMMIHGATETIFDTAQKEEIFRKLATAEAQAGTDAKALEQILTQDAQIKEILQRIKDKKLDQLGENFSKPTDGKIAQFVEKPKPVEILKMLRDLNSNEIIPNAFMIVYTKDGFMGQLNAYRQMTSEGRRLAEYGGSYFQAVVDAQFNPSALEKQPAPTRELFKGVHAVIPKEQIIAAGLGTVGKFTDRGKTQFLSDAYWEKIDQAKSAGQIGILKKGNVEISPNVTINVLPGSTAILENVRITSDTPVTLTLGDTYIQNSNLKLSENTKFQQKTAIVDSIIQKPITVFGGETVVMGLIAREDQPMLDLTSTGSWEEISRVEIFQGETLVSIRNSNGQLYINRTFTKADYKGVSLGKIIEGFFSGDLQSAKSKNPRLFGVTGVSDATKLEKEIIDLPNWRDNSGANVPIEAAKPSMDYVGMNMEKLSIKDAAMMTTEILDGQDHLRQSALDKSRLLTEAAQRRARQMRPVTSRDNVGGIDLNTAKLDLLITKEDGGINVRFDPKVLEEIRQNGVEGLIPVIIDIKAIPSMLPLLSQAEGGAKEAQLTSI